MNVNIDTREAMAEAKFYESYSRFIEEESRYERWDESVARVIEMHRKFYKGKDLETYLEFVQEAYNQKLMLGAQRALQFGGDQLLKHQMKMYNCTSSYADRDAFFGEIFYILLCGAGAGFSVQKHHVSKISKIKERKKSAKSYVVEDSIEGWASSLDVLLSSYFEGGGKHPEFEGRRVFFDLTNIRPKGAMISGGFKAPGPEPLRKALDKIEYLIHNRLSEGENTLRPIDVYDIVMYAADAVLSGGVRRSATICLFSPDDEEMLNAKSVFNWWNDNPQRQRSNNSVVLVRDKVEKSDFINIMERVKSYGEPGFVFVESTEHTTNPCVEIGMYPQIDGKSGWQGCNLTEINGGACVDEESFYRACRAAAILGTLQAGYTDFEFLDPVSKEIFDREALLGVSVTGWMNNPEVLFDEAVMTKGAEIVNSTNEEIAKIIGINPAARTTCVKPSGNASVILKTASGIHGEHSERYIRNVTFNKENEVAQLFMKYNPSMVEETRGTNGGTDITVSFPILSPEDSIYRQDLIGVNLLEKVAKVQACWVEGGTNKELCADPGLRHNVSNTISVDDWDEVADYIFANRKRFAGISMLSMSGDKIYDQAPNTEVINPEQMVEEYGAAGILASGLVVDALAVYNNNLWKATADASNDDLELRVDTTEDVLKLNWIRRFKSFADNYLQGDMTKAEYCLKDAYLIHKWEKIQRSFIPIDWTAELTEKRYTDIDTLGAAACAGGACEIDF